MLYDYLFAFSAPPVPRLLERVARARDAGHRVAVLYLDRQHEVVHVSDVEGVDVYKIPVPFQGASADRLKALPKIAWSLRTKLLRQATQDAFFYTDSLDLLAALRLLPGTSRLSIRYEVRDLHKLQMAPGRVGRIIRMIDRRLMPRVDRLIVTSMGYYDHYYVGFYTGAVTLLENFPNQAVWGGFQSKSRKPGDPIKVGFIGAIRYMACVRALIEGARLARANGVDVQLKIVGPLLESPLEVAFEDTWITRGGPFDYNAEIKELYSDLDIIWSVYDTRIQNVRYALSNKFYETLLSGIPLAVAADTHIGERTEDMGIGYAVSDRDPQAIADMLGSVDATDGWHQRARQQLSENTEIVAEMLKNHALAEQEALFARS